MSDQSVNKGNLQDPPEYLVFHNVDYGSRIRIEKLSNKYPALNHFIRHPGI